MKKIPSSLSDCSVALVYDRVNTPHGGAEKVLLALHELFPKAPLYTSVYDPDRASWSKVFQVKPSWVNNLPGARQSHRLLVPLMPLAFESFDLSKYDIVISITSAEAKGVITHPHQLHLCYLLTPTRYLYSHQEEYLADDRQLALPGSQWVARHIFRYLRWWDQAAAARPDAYLPISHLVAKRAQEYYGRASLPPVYPPVESEPLATSLSLQLPLAFTKYNLVISRLVSYKRVDLAVKASQKLRQPLIIVGDGPEYDHLHQLSQSQPHPELILMLKHQPPGVVQGLLRYAQVLLMPGVEDFGIAALEALNQQTPVIVHHQSGVAELIEDKKTGLHLQELTVNGLMKAIEQVEQTRFSTTAMRQVVAQRQTSAFQQEFKTVVATLWKDHYVKSS